jgi:transposase
LFAAFEVGTVQVKTKSFLEQVIAEQPADKEIHVILDDYSTQKKNDAWLAQFEDRVQFHFTPASASWLNQIESRVQSAAAKGSQRSRLQSQRRVA